MEHKFTVCVRCANNSNKHCNGCDTRLFEDKHLATKAEKLEEALNKIINVHNCQGNCHDCKGCLKIINAIAVKALNEAKEKG